MLSTFAVTLQRDSGRVTIKTPARNAGQALSLVCYEEKVSESAVLSISDVTPYRWIVYVHPPFGGGCDPERVTTLNEACALLWEHSRAMGEDPSRDDELSWATAYRYTQDNWECAEEFTGIGCPFDYPSHRLTIGRRGGIRVHKI